MSTRESTASQRLEQRRYHRIVESGDAKVTIGSWFSRRTFRTRVRDASMTGVSFEAPTTLAVQYDQPVTVEWPVPKELHGGPSRRSYRLRGSVVRLSKTKALDPGFFGVRFDGLVTEQIEEQELRFHRLWVGTMMLLLVAAIGFLKVNNVTSFWYEPVFQTYSVAAAVFILSRLAISLFYREPEDKGYLPAVSVVIAAKNEEDNIAETIRHCFDSKYPSDLLEVIAVDDGSTDRTWPVLLALQQEYPRLTTIRFDKNQGKRHGMAAGAEAATGKILVYVDSDSFVDPEGLYRIVQPFANPKVGAVAGHTLVRLRDQGAAGFISKMEAVRYFISHQVIKAAESVFGAVTCCPGAFSAYRRDLVIQALPKWLHQRFLGRTATFGDDRSLTNFILRTHRVVFHAGARAWTVTPGNWTTFIRQQLRWKKSWMRETTVASRLMLRKHPIAALSYYIGVVITVLSPLMALRALVYIPGMFGASPVPYLMGLYLVYMLLCLVYYYRTRAQHWYYGLAFAGLYLVFFSFQNYYAMVTASRNHWGTR